MKLSTEFRQKKSLLSRSDPQVVAEAEKIEKLAMQKLDFEAKQKHEELERSKQERIYEIKNQTKHKREQLSADERQSLQQERFTILRRKNQADLESSAKKHEAKKLALKISRGED